MRSKPYIHGLGFPPAPTYTSAWPILPEVFEPVKLGYFDKTSSFRPIASEHSVKVLHLWPPNDNPDSSSLLLSGGATTTLPPVIEAAISSGGMLDQQIVCFELE